MFWTGLFSKVLVSGTSAQAPGEQLIGASPVSSWPMKKTLPRWGDSGGDHNEHGGLARAMADMCVALAWRT